MSITDVTALAAIPGDPRELQQGIGFELVARAVRLLLLEGLNNEIDVQSARWVDADSALQSMGADEGVGQVDVTHVDPSNFHEGPHKSLIEAPPEMFPNVSVMAYAAVPSASRFADQVDSSEITLFVECMAISGPVPDGLEVAHESIVHRRIQRMTEAASIVVERDRMLIGTVHAMRTPPQGGVGNSSWLRPQKAGGGQRFIWHGSRLQYTVTRHHAIP